MTGCGKTFFLLEMLEKFYKGKFDNIYLICPTFGWNKTYSKWKYLNDPKFVTIPCRQDDVEDFLRQVVYVAEGTNSLIILDDCAAGKSVKGRTGELVKLAFSARHYGLSTIIITQQLTSVAKPYRENISALVSFYNPNGKDMKTLTDEYLGHLNAVEKREITAKLKGSKYARLEVLLRPPYTHRIVVPCLPDENGS